MRPLTGRNQRVSITVWGLGQIMLTKIAKGLLAFVVYVVACFIVGALAFVFLYYIRGLNDLQTWIQYAEVITVSVMAAFAGAAAGASLLDKCFDDYPSRTIAVTFSLIMLALIGFGVSAQVLYPAGDLFNNVIAPTIRCVAAIASTVIFLWQREA